MSTLNLSELNHRIQLLREAEQTQTDEDFEQMTERFHDLSSFLQKILQQGLQATH